MFSYAMHTCEYISDKTIFRTLLRTHLYVMTVVTVLCQVFIHLPFQRPPDLLLCGCATIYLTSPVLVRI